MSPNSDRGGRPRGTKAQKKKEADTRHEEAFKRAIEDRENGSTFHAAAQRQGLAESSLWHRQNGRQSRAEAHEHMRKLSSVEETELWDWLRELDGWGIHLTHDIITSRANDILMERGSNQTVGRTWIRKFMS
ncbi:hypothetical protein K435DRAFT_676625 [Dendrothele bispora CBS 962.96]|uniref:HTH CENPB-type domain-containing protein n=1 Tax=Dendrothele bispora (strain CBS 962.96) TaxID=1314807 RepID=A0A4S8LLH0_DENBC|nr:hypothetical protein K435DRAFT_676625 [Dendrothele bispora CBS 962.96]